MLALAVMPVVFVLGEQISLGTSLTLRRENQLSLRISSSNPEKCHSDGVFWETRRVERGKPLKLATQTLVGAWDSQKRMVYPDWKQ